MIELHIEKGTKLEIYDTSCIVSMMELYGGHEGEYTVLTIYGFPCSVVVVETKKQIERLLRVKRELFKETEDYTDQLYRYSNEEVIVVATKGDKITVKDQNGKELDIAEIIKVKSGSFRSGFLVDVEEDFYIKPIGKGRFWND